MKKEEKMALNRFIVELMSKSAFIKSELLPPKIRKAEKTLEFARIITLQSVLKIWNKSIAPLENKKKKGKKNGSK